MRKASEQAAIQRQEAKNILLSEILHKSDWYSTECVNRFVDCIIGAALLEMAALQEAPAGEEGLK